MNKSAQRRMDAIKAHSDTWRPEHNGYHLIDGYDKAQIIEEIKAMRSLGRTDRWKNAIDGWAEMVQDASDDNLEWAIVQGGIYAAWEAE